MNSSFVCSKLRTCNTLSQVPLFKSQKKALSHLDIRLLRTINTDGGQRNGKLSVVKKKIDQDFNVENLETENAASAVKRFNFENKHLFGTIANAVQKTCEKIKKKSKRRPVTHATIMTYSETPIPVQDIKFEDAKLMEFETASPFLLTERALDSISNFPLADKTSNKGKTEAVKFNYLRQCLEKVNGDQKYPSVTKILDETVPPDRAAILDNWKLSMISKLGQDGFDKYQKDMLFSGSSLHQCINGYLSNVPELKAEVLPINAGHWESLQSVLPFVKEVRLLEESVTHPFLCYKGQFDCLAKFGNHFVVIDWKTSQKPKLSLSSTYDSPLQIAAYAGALNFDPKLRYMVSKGLIVIAYENGTPATVHFLNENSLLDYWNKWLQRLRTYWEKVQTQSS